MVKPTAETMLADLPAPMRDGAKKGTQVNWKILQGIDEALYAEWRTFFAELEAQLYRGRRTSGFLVNDLRLFNLPVVAGESDAVRRIRLGRHIAKLWGGIHYDSMVQLAAMLVGTDPANIDVVENVGEDGDYAPRLATFRIAASTLSAARIEDMASFLDELSADLSEAAPIGVRIRVELFQGATYDSGATYNSGEVYGT